MSVVNPRPSPDGLAEKKAHEPSMEEILASIRRIIADDQSLPVRTAARDPEPRPVPIQRDVARPVETVEAAGSVPHAASAVPLRPAVSFGSSVAPMPEDGSSQDSHSQDSHSQDSHSQDSPSQDRLSQDRLSQDRLSQDLSSADQSFAPKEADIPFEAVEPGMAHGPIAAPQFAMPDGPLADDLHQPRAAGHPIFRTQDIFMAATAQAADAAAPGLDGRSPVAEAPEREAVEPEASEPSLAPESPVSESLAPEPHVEPEASESLAPVVEATASDNLGLFSAATDSTVGAAFNMLAASRLADNSDELMTLAREMIRPLLRSWIDDNLPSMVERMVRAEIERVARGGR